MMSSGAYILKRRENRENVSNMYTYAVEMGEMAKLATRSNETASGKLDEGTR
jgi:hypothetical protein